MKNITKLLIIAVFFAYHHQAAASEPLPSFAEETKPSVEQKGFLPRVEPDESRLSAVEKIDVRQFKLEGNTVFSDAELSEVLAPYQNRSITAEELQEAKNKLSLYYYEKGYVNSGAVLPDQKVENGVVVLRIIEGKLTRTEVVGDPRLRKHYISSRLELATSGDRPLNINVLQDQLKILKQDPRIENASASLGPGFELGEAVLKVGVEEARPYHLSLKFNNYNSPSIGPYRGEAELSHTNLTGWGDALTAQYALTEGLDEYKIDYSIPLTRRDTTLSFSAERSEALVVAEPFYSADMDIRSEMTTCSVSLRHPFYKTLATEFAAGLKFQKRHSETRLLGSPFSFPGSGADENGETDFNVWRFSQEWVNRSLTRVLAVYSNFSFGDVDGGELGGSFFLWLGQFQWINRIDFLDSQAVFALNTQLSGDTLVSAEKFSLGGSSTVRGYRENQITTDNGVNASLEWRIPVIQLKIPYLSKEPGDGMLHLCPFFDFGKGWNSDLEDPEDDMLYSAGIGARWSVGKYLNAEIYWGKAIKSVEDPDEYDIQDDGIHFQISAGLF